MPQEKPNRRWYQFSLRTMLIVVAALAVCVAAIAYRVIPWIDVSPAIEDGRVVFNVPFHSMNGLLGFEVKDGDNPLWSVDLSYEQGHKIVYGEIPTGGNMDARQTFPPEGDAIPDIRGKKVTIKIEYQFDWGIAPSVGHFKKIVVIP